MGALYIACFFFIVSLRFHVLNPCAKWDCRYRWSVLLKVIWHVLFALFPGSLPVWLVQERSCMVASKAQRSHYFLQPFDSVVLTECRTKFRFLLNLDDTLCVHGMDLWKCSHWRAVSLTNQPKKYFAPVFWHISIIHKDFPDMFFFVLWNAVAFRCFQWAARSVEKAWSFF